jgi:hypothetical protein
MKMAVTVIDSSNLEAVLADARDEAVEQVVAKPETQVKADEKPEPKVDEEVANADEVEDADGITEQQRREFSAKMLKTIGKKHREMKEAEEFASAQYGERKLAEKRAEDLERKLLELQPEQAKTEPAGKPARNTFVGTEDEYIEALADWKTDQKFAKRDADEKRARDDERQQSIITTAKERLRVAAELVPDFAEVTESSSIMIPSAVVGYMQRSEMFAELGYYLSKHPDVAKTLNKLLPDEQLVQIGKIESKLTPFATKADEIHGDKPSAKHSQRETATLSNDDTGFSPSNKARVTAPVIKPLSSSDGVLVESDVRNMDTRGMISEWQKRNKANFNARKRH